MFEFLLLSLGGGDAGGGQTTDKGGKFHSSLRILLASRVPTQGKQVTALAVPALSSSRQATSPKAVLVSPEKRIKLRSEKAARGRGVLRSQTDVLNQRLGSGLTGL